MPRPRAAFTLVELLVVVMIIGILAAIAIPKFHGSQGKANAAALRSDLRNLAVAEEAYYFEQKTYSDDTAALKYRPSPGVTVSISMPAIGAWAATATNPLADPRQCTIYYGNISASFPGQGEGAAVCQ